MFYFYFLLLTIILFPNARCDRREDKDEHNESLNKLMKIEGSKCFLKGEGINKWAEAKVQQEYKLPARLEVCVMHQITEKAHLRVNR